MDNKKKKNTNFKYFFSNKFYDQFTLEKEEILQLLNNDLKYYSRKKKKDRILRRLCVMYSESFRRRSK